MRLPVRFIILALLAAVLLPTLACKPKPTALAASASTAPTAGSSSLIAHAERFGFAAHLPRSTEGYIATLNIPAHMAALRSTTYFRDVTAYLDDKTPAPSVQPTRLTSKPFPLDAVLSDETFVALGQGGTASLTAVRDLMELVQEAQYRSYMAGTALIAGEPADAASPGESTTITNVLAAILSDASMLSRVEAALLAFEVPPLMFGIKSSHPTQLLAQIFDSEQEQRAQANPLNKVFHVSSEKGGQFTLIETTGRAHLTDSMVSDLLARLPNEPTEQAKALRTGIAKICANLQAKKLCLAYGIVQGHVIIATGSQRPSLEFVSDPAASLLARPELAFAQPFAQKPLVSLFFIEGGALQAVRSTAPLQPIVRGLVSGLGESEVFAKILPALQPRLDALATAERALRTQSYSTAVGVVWWDKGLHLEARGGSDAARLVAGQPLKYTSLLTDPGVLFGIDMQLSPTIAAHTRTTFEALASLLYTSAQQMIQAGLGGAPTKTMSTLVESQLLPPLLSLYDASKTMTKTGLGNEQAWLLDLGGQLAPMPGVATEQAKPDAPMLRAIGVLEVADRASLAAGWAQMSAQLTQSMKANPLLFGASPPLPESLAHHGMTTYFYPLPLPSPDLFPCVSINDRVLLLGSARSLNEETARHLLHVRPSDEIAALRWRFSFAKLRAVMKTYTPLLPKPEAKGEIKSLNQWLAPFDALSGKVWAEEGNTRTRIDWEMRDVLKYD